MQLEGDEETEERGDTNSAIHEDREANHIKGMKSGKSACRPKFVEAAIEIVEEVAIELSPHHLALGRAETP